MGLIIYIRNAICGIYVTDGSAGAGLRGGAKFTEKDCVILPEVRRLLGGKVGIATVLMLGDDWVFNAIKIINI
ncbi:MAG: hypothetical protein ORN98_01765 [Alphaproteobacteria bacterium]|nr:hypothetical protein [Alphaproteobacteria bacterium]